MSDDRHHNHHHALSPTGDEGHQANDPALRVEALEALLVEKGLVDPDRIDDVVRRYEEDVGPLNGARAVARAWIDEDFRALLLRDGNQAIESLSLEGPAVQMDRLVVKENTDQVHNVVVCTLCSCYPWAVLGLPPAWYKDPSYRSRVVREPRKVLSEMGLDLESSTEVRVWDSSAEVRYMVLPQRPQNSQDMTEQQLMALVSRDSMVGVTRIEPPGAR